MSIINVLREPTFNFPKVPGRTFFPNLSKRNSTFAAAPLVLNPFVRNQPKRGRRRSPVAENGTD